MVLSDDFYYQPIRLDTINTQIYTDLIAKEGDAGGRGLKVTITENGVTKNTTGITLNLKWEHTAVADLQGLEPFEAVDLTKGIYKLKYPTNMLQKGTVKALIQIIDNGGLAGSRNLKIKVDSTVGDDTAMESSNEFTALVTALVKTNHMENLLNETIANVTVDSEVITARNSTAKQKTFTVLDERMEDLEKDVYYPANNELTQADFAATTGWSVYQGTLAVANNVASVTGTSGLYPNVYQDINCEVGDKLYYAAQARVTTAGAAAIALRSEGVEITTDNARVLAPVANQWYQLDCIKTAFETTPSFAVSQRYALAADATGKVLQVKKPIALNLTKIFGANAIPTIEQIRAILSRFADSHFVGNEGLSQPALLMGKALSLEAQFNAAVAGLTVDDETINARVGKDNTTHATLKARLDSEKSTTDQSLVSLGQQLEQNTSIIKNESFLMETRTGIIAHRGAHVTAPENTIKSIQQAGLLGYEFVELDVQRTSDGVYILMHDNNVDRVTNGTGNVSELPYYNTIKNLIVDDDYANKTSEEVIRVATFEDACKECQKWGIGINIDGSKMAWDAEKFTYISELLKKYSLFNKSFFVLANKSDRATLTTLYPTANLTWMTESSDAALNVVEAKKYVNAFLAHAWYEITDAMIATYKSADIPVMVYDCDTLSGVYKWMSKGIRIVETNTILPGGIF